MSPFKRRLLNLLHERFMIEKQEIASVLWAFFYFFSLLSTNYILRPFRDEMGITAGVQNLPWLFTGTFIVVLVLVPGFGYLIKHYARRTFLPAIYLFFVFNIVFFYALFNMGLDPVILAPVFFIWLGVFNIFIVSVFWSFMTDIFTNRQSKRLFGIITAGGTAGAITGPALASFLAKPLGPVSLLLIAAGMLLFATFCLIKLGTQLELAETNSRKKNFSKAGSTGIPVGGDIWYGFKAVLKSEYLRGIGVLIMLYSFVSTFLYFEQAYIVERAYDNPAARTALFANIDLATNILAIVFQFFVTNRLIQKIGLALVLALVPGLVMLGFVGLGLATTLPVIIIVRVVHRAGSFSLFRPGREILFTVTGVEDRYKAKNVIDTVVYRGADAFAGWIFAILSILGLGLSAIALFAAPVAGIWMIAGYIMGKKQDSRKKKPETLEEKNSSFRSVKK